MAIQQELVRRTGSMRVPTQRATETTSAHGP
jgi:hypothetical protein